MLFHGFALLSFCPLNTTLFQGQKPRNTRWDRSKELGETDVQVSTTMDGKEKGGRVRGNVTTAICKLLVILAASLPEKDQATFCVLSKCPLT